MTASRVSRIGVIAFVLAVALVSLAQRPASSRAEGSTDNVQDIDLAKMVLALEAYGPEYAHFRYRYPGGFDSADERTPGEVSRYGRTNAIDAR